MADKGKKRLIVVLGMHRSGTSAITRALQVMGVELGDNLMPASGGINDKGFWEDLELFALNNELLSSIGSDWHHLAPIGQGDVETLREKGYFLRAAELLARKVEEGTVYGFKDPRTVKLLPFWKEVFLECQVDLRCLLVVRHPLSVVQSLAKRDGFDAEKSYCLWLGHVIEMLSGSSGLKCVLVDYDKLMLSPESEIARIAKRFELEIDRAELEHYKYAFLDKSLQHTIHDLSDLSLDDACPPLVHEIFATLRDVASDNLGLDDPVLGKQLAAWTDEYNRLKQILNLADRLFARNVTANRAVTERDKQIANLEQALDERERHIVNISQAQSEINSRITAIENSTFWKITFPLRRALTGKPTLTTFSKRAVKIVWWSLTFQLANRLRKRAGYPSRIATPHFAPPTDDYCLAIPFDYSQEKWASAPSIAVICHVFYTEMVDECYRYLENIPFPFDIFITTDSQEKRSIIENHFSRWNRGKIEIRIAPNRGRDIAPKLIACQDVYDNYEFVLHIHTKKSPYYEQLYGWRTYLLETLLGSETIVESIFESFRSDPKLGIIAPQHYAPVHHSIGWGWNFENATIFARRLGVEISLDGALDFPSGSMFWARSAALKPLLDCNLSLNEFPNEVGQKDGTLGHIIERLYFFVCERAGYRWIKISQSSVLQGSERVKHVQNEKELQSFIKNSQYELLRPRILKYVRSLLRKLGADANKLGDGTDRQKQKTDQLIYEQSDYTHMDFSQFQHELALYIEKKESLIDFDDNFYLSANRDVANDVATGTFSCGFAHYCLIGQYEGRLWSNYQLKRRFSMAPNFPDGFNAPIHIRPLPRSNIDLTRLPQSHEPFLLIFFSHLQDDLFFAGYTEFFRDFGPIFNKFSKIVLSVENEKYNPRLATSHSNRIEVIQQRELGELKARPDLILAFNSQLFARAIQIHDNPNRTIYYCQDFEAGFFPYGAEYVEAEKAIACADNIIVSTDLLRRFMVDKQLLSHQRIFTTSPKIEPFDVSSEKTKRLFFYFRPESFHLRNLPETLIQVVREFCEKNSGYEIFLVGSVDTRYSYEINGTPVYVISKLPKKEYIQLISSCDAVVSMIYSAHPGVIAFQAAASGIPTVTNVFENRNATLLRQISENIVPYDPVRENLLERVEEALTMPKGKKSFNKTLYSGSEIQSLNDFVDTVLSSE
ncbi:MAG: hypothetical protein H0X43_04220 [Nitrosospira sp.]|nr:hypothetical protein [Nitrosospira sp.]